MSITLKLLGDAPRNQYGQACVRLQCSCGSPEFVCRADSYKQGRTRSCGCARRGGRQRPKPAVAPIVATAPTSAPPLAPVEVNPHERNSVAWLRWEIASKTATAIAAEKDAREFEAKVRENGIQSAEFGTEPPDRLWIRATNMAKKLWEQIARLNNELAKAETSVKKDCKTQAEIVADKLAALGAE